MRAFALVTSIVAAVLVCLTAALPASAAHKKVSTAGAAAAPSVSDPGTTPPPDTGTTPGSVGGGATFGVDPNQTPDMPDATVIAGKAYPPVDAPIEVKEAIWAANEIVGKPYKYGGGHARVKDSGYDCSGTVSYALLGGGLLEDTPLDSSSFMSWGDAGPGAWVTVYTNPSHAFAVIAGLRLDTSAAGDPSDRSGPQWRPVLRSTKGFKARHPEGF